MTPLIPLHLHLHLDHPLDLSRIKGWWAQIASIVFVEVKSQIYSTSHLFLFVISILFLTAVVILQAEKS